MYTQSGSSHVDWFEKEKKDKNQLVALEKTFYSQTHTRVVAITREDKWLDRESKFEKLRSSRRLVWQNGDDGPLATTTTTTHILVLWAEFGVLV